MLSSVALFHSKSGILSGLRASLVLRANALSLGKWSITHLLVVMVLSGKHVPTKLVLLFHFGQALLGYPLHV